MSEIRTGPQEEICPICGNSVHLSHPTALEAAQKEIAQLKEQLRTYEHETETIQEMKKKLEDLKNLFRHANERTINVGEAYEEIKTKLDKAVEALNKISKPSFFCHVCDADEIAIDALKEIEK